MTTLFFIVGILFAIYEFNAFLNPRRELEVMRKIKKDKNYFSSDNGNVSKDERNMGCVIAFIHIFYFLWGIIGVSVSSQWKLFALLLLIGIFRGLLVKIYIKLKLDGGPVDLFTKRIDSIACCAIILEIIFVHFHEFSIMNYISSLF